jgi:hypothetical protein
MAWEDPQVAQKIRRADLVVNAASVPLQIDAELIPGGALVYDIVYGQGTSGLAERTRSRGARWADGRCMLLHQGALAFELWTGRQAPVEVMRETIFHPGQAAVKAANEVLLDRRQSPVVGMKKSSQEAGTSDDHGKRGDQMNESSEKQEDEDA